MLQGGIRQIFTNSYSSSVSQIALDLEPGPYEALLFRFQGTNDTGKTFDIVDMGELDINDSRPMSRVGFDFLDDLAQFTRGIFERTSVISAGIDWFAPYFFAHPDDDDTIFRVANNEKVRVTIYPNSTLATNLGANNLTVTLYGVMKNGTQRYRMKYTKYDVDIVNGTKTFQLTGFEDVAHVFVENNSNINEIRYFMDGEMIIDTVPDVLISQMELDNKIETHNASIPWLELNFNRAKDLDKIINDENKIQIEGSASDTVTLVIVEIDSTPQEIEATQAETAAILESKLNKKILAGKTRPIVRRQIEA